MAVRRTLRTLQVANGQLKTQGVLKTLVRFWKNYLQFKNGRLVGTDKFGNEYYESDVTDPMIDCNSLSGRERWVELRGFDASTVPPEWHAWLHKFTDASAPVVVEKFSPTVYGAEHLENKTGTNEMYTPKNYLKGLSFDLAKTTYNPDSVLQAVPKNPPKKLTPEDL